MEIFMSIFGMAALLGIAVLLSKDKKAINLRTVGGAFAIQLLFGAIVLNTDFGESALKKLSDGVGAVIEYGNDGIDFLFGDITRVSFENVYQRELTNFRVDSLDFVSQINSLESILTNSISAPANLEQEGSISKKSISVFCMH